MRLKKEEIGGSCWKEGKKRALEDETGFLTSREKTRWRWRKQTLSRELRDKRPMCPKRTSDFRPAAGSTCDSGGDSAYLGGDFNTVARSVGG